MLGNVIAIQHVYLSYRLYFHRNLINSRLKESFNCEYKLKRCSNKECCKQCRYVMFKDTMTKWPVQKLAQGTTQKLLQHHDATDI